MIGKVFSNAFIRKDLAYQSVHLSEYLDLVYFGPVYYFRTRPRAIQITLDYKFKDDIKTLTKIKECMERVGYAW